MTGRAPELVGPTKIVLADANVLYSRVLRDYLVYAADEGAISIRWSRAILIEAVKHLQANSSTFDEEQAELLIRMRDAHRSTVASLTGATDRSTIAALRRAEANETADLIDELLKSF